MKLNKSTTVLLNVVLILLVAILFKNLLSFPKSLHAQDSVRYQVFFYHSVVNPLTLLNDMAKQGWHYHSWIGEPNEGYLMYTH